MITVILRFLALNAVNTHPASYWALGFVWLILLVATFSSIRSLRIPIKAKISWVLFVLLVPVLGLFCYALRCLLQGDWSFLRPLLLNPKIKGASSP
jgi:hypothetical protein